jgi:CheY-like chemotaxis protein
MNEDKIRQNKVVEREKAPVQGLSLQDGKELRSAASSAYQGTETLLIAEDEELARMFMKRILENAGYKVIEAADGEETLEKFREKREDISLILSDVIMPKKNGLEILEEVTRLKPGVKMMFSSGYTANILNERGLFKEGIDFIAKPFMKEDLLRKVREALDR